MLYPGSMVVLLSALMATVAASVAGVRAAEVESYPSNWSGQWVHIINRAIEVQGTFDQTKPWGLGF